MTPSPIATELRNFLKKNFQTTPLKAAPFLFGALTVAFAFLGRSVIFEIKENKPVVFIQSKTSAQELG